MRQHETTAAAGGVDAHMSIALLVGTLVASPVLVAALTGRQDVPTSLLLYLVAIVGSWMVVGLIGGAFAMVGRPDAAGLGEHDDGEDRGSDADVAAGHPDHAAPSR